MFTFLHAADIHIDSPLRGLETYEGAPADQMREATRMAFTKLVDLAIEKKVAFVIIAGDLFDGGWKDVQTGLWTAREFRRLEHDSIPVYLIRGNHDAESKVRKAVSWPDNVHEFAVRKPQTYMLESLGVALHGQGFAQQKCLDDLAAGFPDAVENMFNIGVLHTSLTGSANHDTYAPTSPSVLTARGYDYWALGHIHQRSDPPIHERPYIAFSGNTQGRHIKEVGAKGCLLVTVEDGVERVEFCETDVLRWNRIVVEADETDDVGDLLAKVRKQLVECHRSAGDRFCAVRVTICGACAAHRQLVARVSRDEFLGEIRNLANELDEEVWVEKIQLQTRPVVDLEKLRSGSGLVGELLRDIDQIRSDEAELHRLAQELAPMADKFAVDVAEAGIDLEDSSQLLVWLERAEAILASQLAESDE